MPPKSDKPIRFTIPSLPQSDSNQSNSVATPTRVAPPSKNSRDNDSDNESKQEDKSNEASGSGSTGSGSGSTESTSGSSQATLSDYSSTSFNVAPSLRITGSSGSNGLFGDSSVPNTLPTMPVLTGPSAPQYSEWKNKCLSYFQTNGLTEIVTTSAADSLQLAIDIDGGARPFASIKGIWFRLHSKIYGTIRTATEPIVGTTFFDEIDAESKNNTKDGFNIYTASNNPNSTDWISQFKSNNANYLWDKLKDKLQRFTPFDTTRLVDKYMSLKYLINQDPLMFRREFESLVRELRLVGVVLSEPFHMAIWYRALPNELESMKQTLGVDTDLTWEKIYDRLQSHYSSTLSKSGSRKTMLSGTEQICPGIEYDQDEPRSNINQYKDKKKKKKKQFNADPTDGEKYCEFCTIDTHDTSECYSVKKEQKRLQHIMARTNKSAYSSSSTTHFTATLIESELAAAFAPEADGDTDYDKDEEQVNLAGDESPMLFIFDSGTTTHVTPHKHYLTNIQNVPEVNMTTAVRGQHPTIRQRGIVKLNDTWSLSDVAYLPNATSSLISEGRLCDAGFTITKSQELLTVSKNGRVWLRGVRVNRLWVYCPRGAVHDDPSTLFA